MTLDATKNRIMNHMNKDHSDSLADYLAHYCGVNHSIISNASMTDLSDEGMTITYDGADKSYFVPFTPPLVNLEGLRPRVIAMANEAKQK
ncbi:hypothetical protein AKO1_010969 [Acrasis kona]|uniref:DUF2470 domain-containing protein n=1 Tax=Acrasis kona TaxID=1008807 RepID=A0AAW2YRJ5_9EUKA